MMRMMGDNSTKATWNPWHGCRRISSGCLSCPVYQKDRKYGRNPSLVFKTKSFDLPIQKNRSHAYKLNPDDRIVHTCTTSDFFIEEADAWRPDVWSFIRKRPDLTFLIITKRPERIAATLPPGWGDGYDNVEIVVSVESQYTADRRIRYLLSLPIKQKSVIVEPMLGPVRIGRYLSSGEISSVTCGGESGPDARLCDFSWVLSLMLECAENNVPFRFTHTGSNFKKGNMIYSITDEDQEAQAEKSGLNVLCEANHGEKETAV